MAGEPGPAEQRSSGDSLAHTGEVGDNQSNLASDSYVNRLAGAGGVDMGQGRLELRSLTSASET